MRAIRRNIETTCKGLVNRGKEAACASGVRFMSKILPVVAIAFLGLSQPALAGDQIAVTPGDSVITGSVDVPVMTHKPAAEVDHVPLQSMPFEPTTSSGKNPYEVTCQHDDQTVYYTN
jgi:hypothetical protein